MFDIKQIVKSFNALFLEINRNSQTQLLDDGGDVILMRMREYVRLTSTPTKEWYHTFMADLEKLYDIDTTITMYNKYVMDIQYGLRQLKASLYPNEEKKYKSVYDQLCAVFEELHEYQNEHLSFTPNESAFYEMLEVALPEKNIPICSIAIDRLETYKTGYPECRYMERWDEFASLYFKWITTSREPTIESKNN